MTILLCGAIVLVKSNSMRAFEQYRTQDAATTGPNTQLPSISLAGRKIVCRYHESNPGRLGSSQALSGYTRKGALRHHFLLTLSNINQKSHVSFTKIVGT